jgi:hypothetical protein
MIDFFALALSHGLLALGCWRILLRGDLDAETSAEGAAPPAEQPPIKPKPGLRTHA